MRPEVKVGHVVGIVDAFGAVHAEFTGPKMGNHNTFWPRQTFCRWRWSNSEGVYLTPGSEPLTDEQADAIARHLEKRWQIA